MRWLLWVAVGACANEDPEALAHILAADLDPRSPHTLDDWRVALFDGDDFTGSVLLVGSHARLADHGWEERVAAVWTRSRQPEDPQLHFYELSAESVPTEPPLTLNSGEGLPSLAQIATADGSGHWGQRVTDVARYSARAATPPPR